MVFGCVYVARRTADADGTMDGRMKARRSRSINLSVVRRGSVETGGEFYLSVTFDRCEAAPRPAAGPQVGSSTQLPANLTLNWTPASLVLNSAWSDDPRPPAKENV